MISLICGILKNGTNELIYKAETAGLQLTLLIKGMPEENHSMDTN